MAWTHTDATAWGDIEFKMGTPESNKDMSTSLESVGIIKQDTFGVEVQDGDTKEWKAVNGKLIDKLRQEPTLRIKCMIKNLNKKTLEKFWKVEEDSATGKLKVKGMTSDEKLSISFASKVSKSETLEAPYCSVSMKPAYSESDGWMQDVEFTILNRGENKELFSIGQVD